MIKVTESFKIEGQNESAIADFYNSAAEKMFGEDTEHTWNNLGIILQKHVAKVAVNVAVDYIGHFWGGGHFNDTAYLNSFTEYLEKDALFQARLKPVTE